MNMKLFAQLTKIDEEKRLVFGRAADETPDKSGEMLNYAGSKDHFVKWSAEIEKDTDGKSLGNLRSMHGKISAGVVKNIQFDDGARTIDIVAKVIDDQEWRKILEGCYTGFSIGGSYGAKSVEKIADKEYTRYVAIPSEISLVDRPCIPTAKFFQVQKADGTTAEVEFKEPEAEEVAKVDAPEDVEVTGTPDEIIAFGKLMNDKGMTMAQVIALVKGDVAPEGCDQSDWDKMTPDERKAWQAKDAADEEPDADDAAKVAAAEELQKLAIAEDALAKLETAVADLQKIGARNSAADKGRMDAIHKAVVELGADCGTSAQKIEPVDDLQKADAMTKLIADAVAPLQKALDEAAAKIRNLEAQPAAPKVSLRAVTKAQDNGQIESGPTEADLVKDDHGMLHPAASLIKQQLATGGQPMLYRG